MIHPPRRVYDIFLEITNICNFHCPFCPYDIMSRPKGIMDQQLAERVLHEIREKNISQRIVLFLMGEPLLVPYLFELLDKIHQLGLNSIIHTNAGKFSPEMNQQLLDSPLDELHISLQTYGPEAFRLKAPTQMDWENYWQGILAYLEQHYRRKSEQHVYIHFFSKTPWQIFRDLSLNRYVTHSFRFIYRQFEEWSRATIDKDKGFPPLPYTFNQAYSVEILPHIHLISRQVTTFGGTQGEKKNYPAYFGSCNALVNQLGILWDGRVVPCCNDFDGQIVLGDLRQNSLEDALDSPLAERLREDFTSGRLHHPVCRNCRGGQNLWYWFSRQFASWWSRKHTLPVYHRKKMTL